MLSLVLEQHEYRRDIEVALRAATVAGEFLLKSYAAQNRIESIYERDIKIEEDVLSEEIVLDELVSSGYSILSEEKGELNPSQDSELRWIVDPLDGTYNYVRRIPFCAVSIALWKGEEPIFGIVNGFCLQEMFVGVVGTGAWCNNIPIRTGSIGASENSMIASGFPSRFEFSEHSVSSLLKEIKSVASADTLYDKIKSLSGSVASKETVNESSSRND